MGLEIRILPEELRSLPFTTIAMSAAYTGIGTAFAHPIRIFELQNLTDELMFFSFDGVTDHIALPANGFLLLDITTNKTATQGFFIGEGTRIYVRYSSIPTLGAVYLMAFYGAD
jgi:hypothetical protein